MCDFPSIMISDKWIEEVNDSFFRLFIEFKDYAVLMIDTSGDIISWNTGAESLFGYSSSDLIEKHVSLFYTQAEKTKGQPWCNLRIAMDNGKFETEGWRYKKDGSAFYAHSIISAVHNIEGILRGFGVITRDITRFKNT